MDLELDLFKHVLIDGTEMISVAPQEPNCWCEMSTRVDDALHFSRPCITVDGLVNFNRHNRFCFDLLPDAYGRHQRRPT